MRNIKQEEIREKAMALDNCPLSKSEIIDTIQEYVYILPDFKVEVDTPEYFINQGIVFAFEALTMALMNPQRKR